MIPIEKKNQKFLVIDTETAGVDPFNHQLFELACVVLDGNQITDRKLFRLKHLGGPVSGEALKVTGIDLRTWNEQEDTLAPEAFIRELYKFLDSHFDTTQPWDRIQLIGHNVQFDIKFLQFFIDCQCAHISTRRYDNIFNCFPIDTMTIARFLYEAGYLDYAEFNLKSLLDTYGILYEKDELHGALADTVLTAQLYLEMLKLRERKSDIRGMYEAIVKESGVHHRLRDYDKRFLQSVGERLCEAKKLSDKQKAYLKTLCDDLLDYTEASQM